MSSFGTGIAGDAVCDEVVRAVRHRHGDARASSCDECRQDLRHGAERACGEVGDLQRRQRGRRVGERAGPPEVVEVVPGTLLVAPAEPEARDRAVHGVGARVVRSDAEPLHDAGPKALEDDVRAREQAARERQSLRALEVADDGLLAGIERVVPCRRGVAERVALRRLDPHDARAEAQKLAARVRARQVAREVDDEQTRKWWRHNSSNL